MTRQQRRFFARKGERTVGFTPMRNGRIAMLHAWQVVELMQLGVSAKEAEQQAWQNIAKTLPPPGMVRTRLVRPSKSDDPVYRKSIWPAEKIARLGA